MAYGGFGGANNGGGGLGAGGAIFVQQGGSLTLQGGTIQYGSVRGGYGSLHNDSDPARHNDGVGLGSGIFIQGSQTTIHLAPTSGETLKISDVITDQNGSDPNHQYNAPGQGTVDVGGTGTVVLTGADTYTGGTIIEAGATLQLGDGTTDGSITGAVTGSGTLVIDSASAHTHFNLPDVQNFTGKIQFDFPSSTTVTDPVTISGPVTFSIPVGQTVTINGPLSSGTSPGSITVTGGGLLVLNNGTLPVTYDFNVANEDDLDTVLQVINSLSASTDAHFVMTVTSNFTLNSNPWVVNLVNGSLTIDGGGHTIDGADTFRGLFLNAGSVEIDDLTLAHMLARGGDGGPSSEGRKGGGGGGGAGLGGAIFVAARASATLDAVNFVGDRAIGGSGGNTALAGRYAGGGGGMATAGGVSSLGNQGGAGGNIGVGGLPNTGGAGAGSVAPLLGGNGGFGGGGGAGGAVNRQAVANAGGIGGFGGGGGGGGGGASFNGPPSPLIPPWSGGGDGGNGGFGGGGGGAGSEGYGYDERSAAAGAGGFGGGDGGIVTDALRIGGGGGGAGLGGGLFVQAGGTLTVKGGSLAGGLVQGGGGGHLLLSGATDAGTGLNLGSALFIQGTQTVTFAPDAGETLTIADSIADQSGNGGTGDNAGVGSIVKNGAGALVLGGNNSFSGGVKVNAGSLGITSDANLGDAAGGLALANGTTLKLSGSFTVAHDITVAGDPTFDVAAGKTDILAGVIADGTQPGDVEKTGAGTLRLTGANTYSGGTVLRGGTLELGNAQAAGTGFITFATGATATLQIDGNVMPVNTISGFAPGDTIILAGLPLVAPGEQQGWRSAPTTGSPSAMATSTTRCSSTRRRATRAASSSCSLILTTSTPMRS